MSERLEQLAAGPQRLGSVVRWSALAVLWLAAAVLYSTVGGDDYELSQATDVGIKALLGLSFVVVTGFAGQFSLANSAFFGIGAYGSAVLTVRQETPPILAALLSAVLAAAVAFVVGRIVFRLRGHFLSIATLGIAQAAFVLFNNLEITGGPSGMGVVPFSVGGFEFITIQSQFLLTWVVLGVARAAALVVDRGRAGRALRALKDNETAAQGAGIDLAAAKTSVFVLGAVFGSLAGTLYAHSVLYVNPPAFGLDLTIVVLIIAAIGGLTSPWGALLGAIAYSVLEGVIDDVVSATFGEGAAGPAQTLVVALVLVVFLVVVPRGLFGLLVSAVQRARRVVARKAPADPGIDESVIGNLPDLHSGDRTTGLSSVGLTKSFGGVTAVSDVSLETRPGELVAVIGPNGAGKSTLINVLSGVLAPTSGSIQIDGSQVRRWSATAAARAGVARTFQTPAVFGDLTVRENVQVGADRSPAPTDTTRAKFVDSLVAAVGLSPVAGQRAAELSLGQAKVLEIARALAASPSVLLLDEPAAGLNRAEKLALARLLDHIKAAGLAILLVEHDMELVMSVADRIHVLNFGKTLTEGTPEAVRNDPAVIEAYLGTSTRAEAPREDA